MSTTIGAFAGGLVTAAVVYLLAFKRGIQGFRLIIVGIGISAMLDSTQHLADHKADLHVAMMAAIWGSGSLNGRGPGNVRSAPLLIAVAHGAGADAALAPAAGHSKWATTPPRRWASAPNRPSSRLLVIGVCADARSAPPPPGPSRFVALAAPQIARRMTGSGRVSMLSAGVFGALLLLASDLVAQHALAPVQMPVGVVSIRQPRRGCTLVRLLFREARSAADRNSEAVAKQRPASGHRQGGLARPERLGGPPRRFHCPRPTWGCTGDSRGRR